MKYPNKRITRLGIAFVFALATIFFGGGAGHNTYQKPVIKKHPPRIEADVPYPVTHVVDGDTIDVGINGETERIRLIGLDTPETVDPRKPVQCFGVEASNKTKSILAGQKVKIETDPSQGMRDKYGRLLAYIFLSDGMLLNKMMIEEGYGHEYTHHLPYKYQEEFKTAETRARELKKGLWADEACGGTI